jgi:hypothetical protein
MLMFMQLRHLETDELHFRHDHTAHWHVLLQCRLCVQGYALQVIDSDNDH